MPITQEHPTGRLRFLRNKSGKAILQQQWERVAVFTPEEERAQSFLVSHGPESWWQDVPMVSDD